MKTLILAIALVLSITATVYADEGVNWVLLVAGSNEYYNYRHQADICHAYQIVKKNGIPDERIVVMMYDDIANNSRNPVKGKIFNAPDGPDVYNGTIKDYTQKLVTPQNFLKILQGQSVDFGSHKVIKSGPNDNVFVFFADHGAPGLIAFPNGAALYASDLNKAIKSMYVHKQYKNLVFYIEACESGSMFDGLLPENINVYATTAANPDESSYACYYDSKLQTYLGDLYSVNWMEDSDRENIFSETLDSQFKIVKQLTNLSHVMEYGNLTMGSLFYVGDFQAEKGQKYKPNLSLTKIPAKNDAVRTEDVRVSILKKRLAVETDMKIRQEILNEIEEVEKLKSIAGNVIKQIVRSLVKQQNIQLDQILNTKQRLTKHECYKPVVDQLIEKCFSLKNEHVLRNLYVLVNLCEAGINAEVLIDTINKICRVKFFD